jgi:large subunit ribosomal protein L15
MLNRLSPRPGARHRKKRLGRGIGSGHGKTSGRGIKGQGKRSAGRETPLWFDGGQMPLSRRLPKRGFRSRGKQLCDIVNVGELSALAPGTTVDADLLRGRGLIRGDGAPVKLLGDGDAPANLVVRVHKASASARRKIEEAGGRVEIVE